MSELLNNGEDLDYDSNYNCSNCELDFCKLHRRIQIINVLLVMEKYSNQLSKPT